MTQDSDLQPQQNGNTSVYIMGAIAGLLIGLLSAYLYARASEENGQEGPTQLKTMDMMKLAVAMLGIVRQITDLGAAGGKN